MNRFDFINGIHKLSEEGTSVSIPLPTTQEEKKNSDNRKKKKKTVPKKGGLKI